jgi:hypothetical protein
MGVRLEMMLSFEQGDPGRPKGHALLYFKDRSDPSAIFATYLIVPPISVEISKYIPPMFAAQFQQMGARSGITVFPYPPIPERVEGVEQLERMARARGDDLVSGGSIDASSPESLLMSVQEAAQLYFQSYSSYIDSVPAQPQAEAIPETAESVDMDDLLYGLMGDRERLAELTKLSGQLRYAVSGRDERLAQDTVAQIRGLGKYLAEKYRAEEIAQAASRPGPDGDRLTRMYLDRAYKLLNEDYEGLQQLERDIQEFDSASDQ